MILLRPVIAVREIPPNCARLRSELPGIRSFVSEVALEDEQKILQYLQQGVVGCWYPDPTMAYDLLDPPNKLNVQLPAKALGFSSSAAPSYQTTVDPSSVLTDGTWLWPSVLAYYVAKYHVRLDSEFVDHARVSGWTIRQADVKLDNLCWDAFRLPAAALARAVAGN